MGRYYFDTSALVKPYHAEAGTADVRRMLGEAGSESFISRRATEHLRALAVIAPRCEP